MGYQFNRLDYHYNKHVLGKDNFDKRSASIKKRESDQWLLYRKIKNKYEYQTAAEENIKVSKRVYTYMSNGKVSTNYQKELVQYKKEMANDEFDGLLTTCVGQDDSFRETNLITTCFYKTTSFKNIEVLNMAQSIFSSGNSIVKTSNNIYIDGFNLNTFKKEYGDSLSTIYSEYLLMYKYNDRIYIKRFLMEFLKRNIVIVNKNSKKNSLKYWEEKFFSLLLYIIEKWITCYDNKQSFMLSEICKNNPNRYEKINNIVVQIDDEKLNYDIYPEIKSLLECIINRPNYSKNSSLIKLFSIYANEYAEN